MSYFALEFSHPFPFPPFQESHSGYLTDDPNGGLTNGSGGRREGSASNLQHISEREPDDWKEDPSLHPTTGTMFMEKSKQAIQSE